MSHRGTPSGEDNVADAACDDRFARWVLDGLRQLYDTASLRENPLCDLVADEESPLIRCQRIRGLLLDAIQALRPARGVPSTAQDRRSYRLLELRYVEGASVQETADRLGIGRSQYYRDHAQLLEVFVSQVWERCAELWSDDHPSVAMPTSDQVRSEAERVSIRRHSYSVRVDELLMGLEPLLQGLCESRQCSLRTMAKPGLSVRAPSVLARQAVLLAVQAALAEQRAEEILVSSYQWGDKLGIRVIAHRERDACKTTSWDNDVKMLADCGELVEQTAGKLHILGDSTTWEARLEWAEKSRFAALLVDDNAGISDLFRRYLSGSRWELVTAHDGVEARRLIEDETPDAIILDVLLPEEDGWAFLERLRNEPRTAQIPVLICSVLSQPELARTLGACAHLPKPVTQRALLDALRLLE